MAAEIISYLELGISLTKKLYNLTQKYAEAPENASTMRLFNDEISALRLELLCEAIRRNKAGLRQLDTLKEAAQNLNDTLADAHQYLYRNGPTKGDQVKRFLWASWKERKALELFEDVRVQLDVMQDVMNLAALAPRRLKPLRDYSKCTTRTDLKNSPVGYFRKATWIPSNEIHHPSEGNLSDTRREPRDVFIESQGSEKEAKRVAGLLWWSFSNDNTSQTGLLPCVGYIEHRVVFLLPQNTAERKTLRDLIHTRNQPAFPLEARFTLARQLSEALLRVHSAGLTHTAIRTDNILFLSPSEQPSRGSTTKAEVRDDNNAGSEMNNMNISASANPEFSLKRVVTGLLPGKGGNGNKIERTQSFLSVKSGKERGGILSRLNRYKSVLSLKDQRDTDAGQDNGETGALEPTPNPAEMGAAIGNIPSGCGNVYLIHWSSIQSRGKQGRSLNRDWSKDVYRHPEQQGDYTPEHNMGHDIYSLGVCLIEIALWSTFVKHHSQRREHGPLVKRAGLKDALQKDPPDSLEVKRLLIQFAEKELPSTVGTRYATLVKQCLLCLDAEGRNVWKVDFTALKRKSDCKAFRQVVLSFLLSANQTLLV